MLNDVWKTAGKLAKAVKKKEEDIVTQDLKNLKELNEIDALDIVTAMAPTPVPTTE